MVGQAAGGRWASVAVGWQRATATDGPSWTQIITVASIALTILLLGFSLWKGLNRARLRPLLDVARVALQAATAVAVPLITGVTTAPGLLVAALVIGLVLGLLQGRRLQLEIEGDRLFATRSVAGFAVWGVGLVLMQGAGLANRTGLVEIGQAVTWLSIGITAGLILGRHGAVAATLQAAATRATPVVLIVVALLGACVDAAELDTIVEADGSGSFEIAIGAEPDPDEPLTCDADEEVPGTYTYADNRGQGLQWCVIGFTFASLDQLAQLYVGLDEGQGFITVECLAFVEDIVAYKIVLQIDENEEGDTVPWRVTVPGPIDSSNADFVEGSTATWNLGSTLGQIPLDINVGESGRCPSAGLALQIAANADGSGTATLRAPRLSTGDADTAVFVADLVAAGWPAVEPAPGVDTFEVTRAFGSGAELDDLVSSLPPLEGTTIELLPEGSSGEVDFEAFVDLSFYESYWVSINPTLGDPPFRLSYLPADGIVLTSGDWTDERALSFDWTVESDGRIFNLFATTGPDGEAVAPPGATDAEGDGDGNAGSDPEANDESAPSDSPSTGDETGDETGDGGSASPPVDMTEAEAAQALLDLLDSQEVSENEALATALAGLAAAAAAGLLTLAEAARAAQELADAAARNAAERRGEASARPASGEENDGADGGGPQNGEPPERADQPTIAPRPPGPLRQMSPQQLQQAFPHVSKDELERLLDTLQQQIDESYGRYVNPELDDVLDLDGIRERIANGTVTPEDLATLVRGQDFTGTAQQAGNVIDAFHAQRAATATRIGEGFVEGTMMTAKAAASTAAGPLGGALMTAAIDTVAAREQGWAQAIEIGLFHAAADLGQGRFAQAIGGLPIGQRISGGALSGGFSAWAQNLHDQLAANGGDIDGINWDQANNAGLLGMGFGGLGGVNANPVDPPTVPGRPRGFSGDLGDGFSTGRANAPDLPSGNPARPTGAGGDGPTPTAPRASAAPDGPAPTTRATNPDATAQAPRPTTDGPTNPDATAQPSRPVGGREGGVTAPADQDHMSVRPEPNPNADLPPGQATNPETQRILDNLETSPRAGIDAGGPGRPNALSDLDHEGNVWVGGRRVGTMNSDGQLVNADGQPIRVAHDLETGASVGYVEVDTSGLPGRPVHNHAGQQVGRVSESGHILNPDGSIQMHDGAPARAAIDADGNLVPYDGPDLADVRPEYDQAYSGRRVEHPNPDRTPAPDLHALAPETRIPVLDARGNPSHMVEAVPREVHFGADGQPEFVQHRFPARAQTMDDVNLPGHTNPRFDPEQGQLGMPTPDNWGSSTVRTPLTGPDAPPPAPVVRADSTGATPTGYAATTWDAVGANADGVAVSPSGTPVVRVDARGNFFDLSGNPVTNVAARDGRVIGFTDSGGQRWIVDDGPSS